MRLRVNGIGIVIAALTAIGCSDRNQPLPAAPRMQAAASTSNSFTCDFKSLSNLATHYFSSAEAKVVRGLISQMQTAGAFTTAAQDIGFGVMAHIASNIKAGNSDVVDASNLTNGLLVCMYDPTSATGKAALPASFSATVPAFEDFSVATNPADSGAYDVRGGTSDLTDAVLSRPASGPFSGVAPCSAQTCTTSPTWTDILSANSAPKRILVYGEPDLLSSDIYEWRIVPRNTTFSPAAIVGFCIPAATATTSLIHENSDLLPFVEQDFVPPCPSRLAAQSSSSQFASRLARWGIDLFGPRPLSATTYLNPGGLAGSTGSIHSLFGPQVVDAVTLTFTVQPTDVTVGQVINPPVEVTATAAGTTTPVPNVSITLAAVNNNGTPAVLGGTLTQTTGADGRAIFDNLFESKTGAYTLVTTTASSVGGRPNIAVPTATSDRFNVRP